MIASPATEAVSSNREVGAANQKPAPEPAPVAARRTIIGASGANLRAGPSTAAAVITTLPHDTEVALIERRGAWVLIRVGGGNGSHVHEGWVYGSTLKDVAGP